MWYIPKVLILVSLNILFAAAVTAYANDSLPKEKENSDWKNNELSDLQYEYQYELAKSRVQTGKHLIFLNTVVAVPFLISWSIVFSAVSSNYSGYRYVNFGDTSLPWLIPYHILAPPLLMGTLVFYKHARLKLDLLKLRGKEGLPPIDRLKMIKKSKLYKFLGFFFVSGSLITAAMESIAVPTSFYLAPGFGSEAATVIAIDIASLAATVSIGILGIYFIKRGHRIQRIAQEMLALENQRNNSDTDSVVQPFISANIANKSVYFGFSTTFYGLLMNIRRE